MESDSIGSLAPVRRLSHGPVQSIDGLGVAVNDVAANVTCRKALSGGPTGKTSPNGSRSSIARSYQGTQRLADGEDLFTFE